MGVRYIAIPGLCIGVAQDLCHEDVGYLALYRKDRCTITNRISEERSFILCCRHILQPFIDLCREKLYGWKPSLPIPDELTAICWTDGASVQLNAIVNEE